MWPRLRDIAAQVPWPVFFDGRMDVVKLSAEEWKDVLTAGLEKQQRMAAGIEGGYVLIGKRTSKFSNKKMEELLELIKFFGDSRGVKWSAPKRLEAGAPAVRKSTRLTPEDTTACIPGTK